MRCACSTRRSILTRARCWMPCRCWAALRARRCRRRFPRRAGRLPPQATVRSDLPPVLDVTRPHHALRRRGGWFRLAGRIHAVEQVSLTVRHGETLALVGECGCGKSTTGRSIIRLEQPDAGEIRLNAEDVTRLDRAREARLRRGGAVCVPGSVRLARSAADDRVFHRRTDPHASAARRRGGRAARA